MSRQLVKYPTNWFTGSLYYDHLSSILAVQEFFSSDPNITDVWYQLERGRGGNLHWQYTFHTDGDQQRFSFWFKRLPFVVGEYIDGCKNEDICVHYCQKEATRVRGPYEWHRPPPVVYEVYQISPGDSERTILTGLVNNQWHAIARWNDMMKHHPDYFR